MHSRYTERQYTARGTLEGLTSLSLTIKGSRMHPVEGRRTSGQPSDASTSPGSCRKRNVYR